MLYCATMVTMVPLSGSNVPCLARCWDRTSEAVRAWAARQAVAPLGLAASNRHRGIICSRRNFVPMSNPVMRWKGFAAILARCQSPHLRSHLLCRSTRAAQPLFRQGAAHALVDASRACLVPIVTAEPALSNRPLTSSSACRLLPLARPSRPASVPRAGPARLPPRPPAASSPPQLSLIHI